MRSPLVMGGGAAGRARVPRWSQTAPGAPPDYSHLPTNHQTQPYPYQHQINDRLAIWQGDMTRLQVDVMVNSTDETLLESNVISDRIISGAGPRYKEEVINQGYECSVGEVCVSPGFDLPCRHLVHTVCPNYSHNQQTAAETALQNCYRNILSACVRVKARSVCVPSVTSPRPDFPPDLAAHIALREIRNHLEQSSLPEVVVLVSESGAEVALWSALAPLYFPRSHREAHANRWRLPAEAVSERRIRIIHNPHITPEDDTAYDDTTSEAAVLFARAVSTDTTRLLAPPVTQDYSRHLHEEQYERLLRRAQTEDLSEVSGIGCLYQSGVDRLGRPVVVFIGKWFPIADINLDKALLYLIKLLDPIVRGDYVIAYFHTLASSGNHPPFSWLKEVYSVLPYKYKKNLKAFYIIHPTFWTKMMTWWFLTFMAPAIKTKVQTLPGVEYLYSVLARDQLELPAFVTEYDMTINGLHYFQPELNTSST